MLEVRNLKKQYNNTLVLDNINLKFAQTGLVCILGPSGSGKSTLLNLIGALDTPTSGVIYYNFLDINKLTKKDIDNYHRHEVGFIFQHYNLINYLTVEDNILIGHKKEDISYILEKLNISHLKKKKVFNLSGGEQERVAIARALYNEPKVLLGDEPTGALDSKTSTIIMNYLKEYAKDHLVILVTHDELLARAYANRIIRISDGHIISDSNPYNINEEFNTYDIPNQVISFKSIINIAYNNFKKKKKRYLFSILASLIGLVSLMLILSITNGFNKSLDNYEKKTLSKYPIVISKTGTSLESQVSSLFTKEEYSENKLYIIKENTTKIDYNLLNKINKLSNKTNFIQYSYILNNYLYTTFKSYNQSIYDEMKLLKGEYPKYNNEVLLVLGSNNELSESEFFYLNISNKTNLDSIINHTYTINNIEYTITGISKFKESSPLYGTSLIVYNSNLFNNYFPEAISLYPINYQAKQTIKSKLSNIEYLDYATSIKNISKDIIKMISFVLIIFSSITLCVSILTIALTTYISIIERTHEIGLLSSLGIERKNIKNIFYLENIITASISAFLSIVIVLFIKIPFNRIITHYISLNNLLRPNMKIILLILITNIIISIIGSIFPLTKIKKLKIVEALTYE